MMSPGRLLWQACPLRAVGEGVVVCGLILGLFLATTNQPLLIPLLAFGLAPLTGLFVGLRARLTDQPWTKALLIDSGLALLLAAGLGLILLPISRQSALVQAAPFFLTAIGGSVVALLITRLIARLWRRWQVARRQRLLWAMVHTHLLMVLAILGLYLIFVGLQTFLADSGDLLTSSGEELTMLRLSVVVFIMLGTAIIAMPGVAFFIGLAGLVSYLTVRPITRRIETLAQAVGHFRQTHQPAPLTDQGQDEIAQLSADFQVMAADLHQTLTHLQHERDTVAGLLRTRRELIAGVSHELRTPLATARSYLESMAHRWPTAPSADLKADLDTARREIDRLQGLIDDLFALSRAEVGQLTLRPEPTDIGPLLRRVVETAAPLAWQSGRVKVAADLPEAPLPALVDAARLEQILRNLLQNGVRHTPPGGIVILSAQAEPERVVISVSDTGEGIAPADLPYIWQQFYRRQGQTADRDQSGLGLALVKSLTEALGGQVGVESQPCEGSQFTIRLPLK